MSYYELILHLVPEMIQIKYLRVKDHIITLCLKNIIIYIDECNIFINNTSSKCKASLCSIQNDNKIF